MSKTEPRYYVQGETVRGEPRQYWVADRHTIGREHEIASHYTTDRRQAQRWCNEMNGVRTASTASGRGEKG